MIAHRSVMPQEVLTYLDVHSNLNYIDCTLGGGGHTEAILERNAPQGKVIAFELDEETIVRTKERLARFGDRLVVLQDTFRNIANRAHQALNYETHASGTSLSSTDVLFAAKEVPSGEFRNSEHQELPIAGILYDLGLSTDLLVQSGRGFSFTKDEPLDMRFGTTSHRTAADIVNREQEKKIADIIYQYGEERFSRSIARAIVLSRAQQKITTTAQLTALIESAVPPRYRHGKIHCATRTFQALRIAVNDELGALEYSLEHAPALLQQGGRIVVIAFHSLEDRIVKQSFRKLHLTKRATILTKKPIQASEQEVQDNPPSRSAKLRAVEIK